MTKDRLTRLEERHAKTDERLATVEKEQLALATGTSHRFDMLEDQIGQLHKAVLGALDALGDRPSKNTIGFKPTGNPVSPREVASLERYYRRALAGSALTRKEANAFSALAQKAKAEYPADRSLRAVAAIAGFALGLARAKKPRKTVPRRRVQTSKR